MRCHVITCGIFSVHIINSLLLANLSRVIVKTEQGLFWATVTPRVLLQVRTISTFLSIYNAFLAYCYLSNNFGRRMCLWMDFYLTVLLSRSWFCWQTENKLKKILLVHTEIKLKINWMFNKYFYLCKLVA